MRATTIKVEGELLLQLERSKPKSQSLTTFVRSVLQQEVRRRQVTEAAEEYRQFLQEHGEEAAWLEQWDRADLASAPRHNKKK